MALSNHASLNTYYMLCTPYLKKELIAYMETRETRIAIIRRGFKLERLFPSDVNEKRKMYSKLRDKHGRTQLSMSIDTALENEVLLFVYTDGKTRKRAFALLESISQQRVSSGLTSQIAHILGGSLGLGQVDTLGDKIQMATMLNKHQRTYVPWTRHWNVKASEWQTIVKECLTTTTTTTTSTSEEEIKEYVICKPSNGQQQRGILICERTIDHYDEIIDHCTKQTLEGGPYTLWVMQQYIANPYCLSGRNIGTLPMEPLPKITSPKKKLTSTSTTSRQKPKPAAKRKEVVLPPPPPPPPSSTSSLLDKETEKTVGMLEGFELHSATTSNTSQTMTSSRTTMELPTISSPSPTTTTTSTSTSLNNNKKKGYPSDSGALVSENAMYKVHFRYYAMVVHDAKTPMEYKIFTCDLFKVYHSKKPYKKFSLDFDENISKYVALTTGNDCMPEQDVKLLLPKFNKITMDIVELAIQEGGMLPFGFSRISFQNLGLDFLYDTVLNEVILLEVNINPGQGIMKQESMYSQGMSANEYTRLVKYWSTKYRQPYVTGMMNITLAPFLNMNHHADTKNEWKLGKIVTISQPPKICQSVPPAPHTQKITHTMKGGGGGEKTNHSKYVNSPYYTKHKKRTRRASMKPQVKKKKKSQQLTSLGLDNDKRLEIKPLVKPNIVANLEKIVTVKEE